ncbi:hypothetical protein B8V81_0135 [Paenibacillus pasadenensis]|uniref:Polyprenyl synthetase n=1 Tax=Paenibacillus pasadenensis TaxID=217090 RepID=A0A2N5NCE9_9BACL|nr:hypothetical protein [Paenibacillus pasadenensis]PLT48003.1 hypothetical protein B8V81_0135 [Paenibacillus pasadenensis]
MSIEWSLESAKRESAAVFAQAREGTAACPEPLCGILRQLIDRADPSAREGGANFIAYLLPVWTGEQAGLRPDVSRELAVGSVYMMLHYFLLDDVMDGDEIGLGPKEALAAGQLLHSLFLERYERAVPGTAELWSRYRAYTGEWAQAVSQEGRHRAEPQDAAALAAKSAPVKIGAAAVWLAAGRPERIAGAEQAAELALASLQLADDWSDWRDDLAAGEERSNAFLTLARRALEPALPEEQPLEERLVRRAAYQFGAVERLAKLARDHREELEERLEAPPGLAGFHQAVLAGVEADARKMRQTASKLAVEGGFSHFLSNRLEL